MLAERAIVRESLFKNNRGDKGALIGLVNENFNEGIKHHDSLAIVL